MRRYNSKTFRRQAYPAVSLAPQEGKTGKAAGLALAIRFKIEPCPYCPRRTWRPKARRRKPTDPWRDLRKTSNVLRVDSCVPPGVHGVLVISRPAMFRFCWKHGSRPTPPPLVRMKSQPRGNLSRWQTPCLCAQKELTTTAATGMVTAYSYRLFVLANTTGNEHTPRHRALRLAPGKDGGSRGPVQEGVDDRVRAPGARSPRCPRHRASTRPIRASSARVLSGHERAYSQRGWAKPKRSP